MLDSVKTFFNRYMAPAGQARTSSPEHNLQVATAALLIEMMRADFQIDDTERRAAVDALRSCFELGEEETAKLMELAETERSQATSLYDFTSQVNDGYSREAKVQIIELLWRVAYADKTLQSHEQHLMRKLAGLLYISHKDYIAAKFRAREAAGLGVR
jgi:uncharacterized tellurite resistance protein B-like protein